MANDSTDAQKAEALNELAAVMKKHDISFLAEGVNGAHAHVDVFIGPADIKGDALNKDFNYENIEALAVGYDTEAQIEKSIADGNLEIEAKEKSMRGTYTAKPYGRRTADDTQEGYDKQLRAVDIDKLLKDAAHGKEPIDVVKVKLLESCKAGPDGIVKDIPHSDYVETRYVAIKSLGEQNKALNGTAFTEEVNMVFARETEHLGDENAEALRGYQENPGPNSSIRSFIASEIEDQRIDNGAKRKQMFDLDLLDKSSLTLSDTIKLSTSVALTDVFRNHWNAKQSDHMDVIKSRVMKSLQKAEEKTEKHAAIEKIATCSETPLEYIANMSAFEESRNEVREMDHIDAPDMVRQNIVKNASDPEKTEYRPVYAAAAKGLLIDTAVNDPLYKNLESVSKLDTSFQQGSSASQHNTQVELAKHLSRQGQKR